MEKQESDQPPLFRNWKGWYWLLLGVLVVEIVTFLLITNSFS